MASTSTLRAALSLALSGTVTSVTLAATHRIGNKQARKRLNAYAERGYLVRVGDPLSGPYGTTVYAITTAGHQRLARLNAEAATTSATGGTGLNFEPLMAALQDGGR